MESYLLVKGLVYSFMTAAGILGNIFVLLAFFLMICQQQKLVPAEIILFMLGLANLLYNLTLALAHTVFIFKLRYLVSDGDCKAVLYLARVSRALSICLTSLLSSCQCAALASQRWRYFRLRSQKHLCFAVSSLLLISMASSISTAFFAVSGGNITNFNYTFNLGYCLVIYPDRASFHLIGFISFARDLVFVVIMVLSSTYILWILYRHAKQVRGIRSADRMKQGGAETQAAKMVVTLVLVYVLIFGIDNAIWFYQFSVPRDVDPLNDVRHLLSAVYATVFPVVVSAFNRKFSINLLRCPRGGQITGTDRCLNSHSLSGVKSSKMIIA